MRRDFLIQLKWYLESEYKYEFSYTQDIHVENNNFNDCALEIQCKDNGKLIKTIPNNIIQNVYKLWCNRERVIGRLLYTWQKEIIDYIEGS